MRADFVFWQRWLFVVSVAIVIFGMAMALLSSTPMFDLFHRQIDPAFWESPGVGIADPVRAFQGWIYGVLGATMAGWGVCLVFVVHYPFKQKKRWAWRCLSVGLGLWFVVDTLLSFMSGVYFNVVFNLVLALLVTLPLIFTRRDFVL